MKLVVLHITSGGSREPQWPGTPKFSDINLTEDNGTTTYDINVTDIESDDINLTVESNNTNILTVSQGWSENLNSSNYNKDFNLTTVKDQNGIVRITITLKDTNTTIETFDVNVTAVNDAPVATYTATIDAYEDINKTIDLNATDIDSDSSTFKYYLKDNNTSTTAGGIVSLEENGTLTYRSKLNYNGMDSFSYIYWGSSYCIILI